MEKTTQRIGVSHIQLIWSENSTIINGAKNATFCDAIYI